MTVLTRPAGVTARFVVAHKAAVLLAGHLTCQTSYVRLAELFSELMAAVHTLPPDDGHRLATVLAVRTAVASGERLAARWQLVQLARRLRAERNEWVATTPTTRR